MKRRQSFSEDDSPQQKKRPSLEKNESDDDEQLSFLSDDQWFEVSRYLRSPIDYHALAQACRRLDKRLHAPGAYQPMHDRYFEDFRRVYHNPLVVLPTIKHPTPEMYSMAVKRNPIALRYVPLEFQTKEMCLMAVTTGPPEILSSVKRQTEAICLAAVGHNSDALIYVEEPNDAIYIRAVTKTGKALCHIVESEVSPFVIRAALASNGLALEDVDISCRSRELCLVALRSNGLAFIWVPDPLKTDRELQLAAVCQNGLAIEHIPDEIQTLEIQMAAVRQNGMALQFIPKRRHTFEMCKLAVTASTGRALQYVSPALRTYSLCLYAVKLNGEALEWVPLKLRSNYRIIEEAVRNCPSAIRHMQDFMEDESADILRRLAVTLDPCAIASLESEFRTPELILMAVQACGLVIGKIYAHQWTPAIMLAAVKQDGLALRYIYRGEQTVELCRAAMAQNPLARAHVKIELPDDE